MKQKSALTYILWDSICDYSIPIHALSCLVQKSSSKTEFGSILYSIERKSTFQS